jgi:hypothetical protein
MMPADAIAQSSRVCVPISRIVGTPRPIAPTSQASAASNSTSLDALERLPTLSFSRCTRIALRVPSARQRGTKKHDSPAGESRSVCASTRCASHCGAEKNHLWPVIR